MRKLRDQLNPYQKKILQWKGKPVEVTFINDDNKLEGTVMDVDIWRNKFLLQTDEGEVLVLGGVSMIRRKDNLEVLGDVDES